ncbi:MAG TPA: hypothetical protein VGM53_02935 [Streptosporangiaceae bacterium]|jgi:hypothetical protein
MSDRRFDMSGQQITASVLAAVTGAVLASYLGVAGTIIGTAVMSVAGTAGTAVYKHYLGRTAGHLKETAKVAAAHRAAEWMTAGTRTAVMPGQAAGGKNDTEPAGTEGPGPPGDGGADPAGEAGRDDSAAATSAGWLARWRAAVLGWPMWLRLAAASAVVFVGVIGAVSVVEVAAGKPLQTVVWNHKASGTTVGNLVGSQPAKTKSPARRHAKPSGTASSSPPPASRRTGSASPSVSPSSSSPSPSPSPSTSTSSPPASSSPSPSTARSGTAKAATG